MAKSKLLTVERRWLQQALACTAGEKVNGYSHLVNSLKIGALPTLCTSTADFVLERLLGVCSGLELQERHASENGRTVGMCSSMDES